MWCAYVLTNGLSCICGKSGGLFRWVAGIVQEFQCLFFGWWLQSGEQMLRRLVVRWLMMVTILLKPFKIHILCYTSSMNVYLLHEAVLLGKPLLPDVSATSKFFIQLLINPLHCALQWFVLLSAFLDYLRPGLQGQQTSEGRRIRGTAIHLWPFCFTWWVNVCVLTVGDWGYQR